MEGMEGMEEEPGGMEPSFPGETVEDEEEIDEGPEAPF
jgi:hypothetical protein